MCGWPYLILRLLSVSSLFSGATHLSSAFFVGLDKKNDLRDFLGAGEYTEVECLSSMRGSEDASEVVRERGAILLLALGTKASWGRTKKVGEEVAPTGIVIE